MFTKVGETSKSSNAACVSQCPFSLRQGLILGHLLFIIDIYNDIKIALERSNLTLYVDGTSCIVKSAESDLFSDKLA